jgi:bacterioferritin-associated ferredoxin
MIVCSCNVLTDHDVRSVVQTAEDPLTASDVYGCLGCSRQCGRCARTIKRIMNETMVAADSDIGGGGDGLRAATLDFQLAEEAA